MTARGADDCGWREYYHQRQVQVACENPDFYGEADIAELVANAFEFGCRARMEFSDRILFRFACGTGWLRRTVQ